MSVALGRSAPDDPSRVVASHGLLFAVRDLHPEDEPLLSAPAPKDGEALTAVLEGLAGALARSGADLLDGDDRRAPRLRRLRAEETRRRNVERFGTSTGETPRFDSRPTLEDLFADAANEGLRVARAYQAHWDYGYSLDTIADFLGVDAAAVQAMLDRWDGLG